MTSQVKSPPSPNSFTPGPWMLGPSESPGPHRIILGPPISGQPFSAKVIAHVYSGIADDRLIAAAPAMFEALSLCLPIIDDESDVGQAIRAALKQARGL